MTTRNALLVILSVAAWSMGGGCSCPDNSGRDGGLDASVEEDAGFDAGEEDAGEIDGGQDDAGTDGGEDPEPTDAGPTAEGCIPSNAFCSDEFPCCSANCNDGVCGEAILCKSPDAACSSNTDCCSGSCVSGTCSETRCKDLTETCAIGADCCSGLCTASACASQSAGTCLATGSSCDEANDTCCSQNCQDGVCQKAYSCQANSDVCWSDGECCSLSCTATGGNAGFCVNESGRPAGCGYGGTPCSTGSDCCSFVCVDPGTGQKVCQEVSGCQVAGDSCASDANCCGGQPNGSVDCHNDRFYCDNGQACRAPGTICGKPQQILPDGGIDCERKPDGTCFTVSQETNCCDASGNFKEDATCRVDESGVPRCFGGGDIAGCIYGYTGEEPCCIADGQVCQFSDQCCGGAPCVAGDDGVPRCTVPQCLNLGTTCTPGATGADACCSGSECLAVDEINYACQLAGSADGGTTCNANGDTCATSSDCCSEICEGGVCQAPELCQPQDASCSVSGDCCSGLTCIIPTGASSGTCELGSTCPEAGQTCSPTNLCCNEGVSLSCLNSSGFACDGTTSCACEFILTKTGSEQAP